MSAGKTDTFLGERYRRIARRRGKKRALVAVGRSILVIVWHLLSDDEAHFHDLGANFYDTRLGIDRLKRNHVRQLEAPRLHRHPATRRCLTRAAAPATHFRLRRELSPGVPTLNFRPRGYVYAAARASTLRTYQSA